MVRLYRTFSNLIYTVVTRCVGYLYTVSEWFNPLEPPRTFSNYFSAEKARVEPLRTHVKDFYTPFFLCTEVVREGSRRFEGIEPLGNSVQVPYTPCYHCEDEVREGSVQSNHSELTSNHSELTSKTSTHLAFSALKWFEKVRGGSRGLNHSVIVYRYPTQLVPTVFEKVRYCRTTPNSRQRLLHTLLSLH